MAFMVPIQYTAKLGEQNNTLVEFRDYVYQSIHYVCQSIH